MPKNLDAEKNNPCLKESDLAQKCLEKNSFDKEKCEAYFLNYKTCKDFWYKIRSQRRSQGIHPHLPDIAEREAIKAEYMKKMNR